jgi:hypothetical protein
VKADLKRRIDLVSGPAMFAAASLFLIALAFGLQDFRSRPIGQPLHLGTDLRWLIGLWPLFVLELLFHWSTGNRHWKQHIWHSLLPPLRLGGRDHRRGQAMWLPRLGWVRPTRRLQARLEQAFSLPMMIVAIAILPILGLEFAYADRQSQHPWLTVGLELGTSIIWLAFTVEFIVMVSVVDNRRRYCQKNWVSLVIILLPLLSFLRVLRLGSLLKLQQVTRASRVYKLRGVLLRLYRALLALNILRLFWRLDHRRQLQRLEGQRQDLIVQLTDLDHQIRQLQQQLAEKEENSDRPKQRRWRRSKNESSQA